MFRITPYVADSFDIFSRFNELDKNFFNQVASFDSFKTDVIDKDDRYIVESELAGFKKEDIKLDINGDLLTISAEHSNEDNHEGEKDTGKYVCRERTFSSFKKTFNIKDINIDAIEAEYTNGILTITLPKKPETIPVSKRLDIK